jgi:hypothetical protein
VGTGDEEAANLLGDCRSGMRGRGTGRASRKSLPVDRRTVVACSQSAAGGGRGGAGQAGVDGCNGEDRTATAEKTKDRTHQVRSKSE